MRYLAVGACAFLALACGEMGSFTPDVARLDSAGVEVVTSSGGDRRVAWSATEELALGGEEEGPASFYSLSPTFLGTDDRGRIHVLHYVADQVVTFDRGGSLIRTLGREGGGPGELERPAAMSVTATGDVSVFDFAKLALVRWDSTGALLDPLPFPHMPSWGGRFHALTPAGYIVSTGGSIDEERVQRLIAVTGEDTTLLAVAPQPDQGMVRFEGCGGSVSFPPLFTPTIAWDHRDGITAVVAGAEYRIDIWRDTTLIRSIRRPVPVRRATRELAIAEAGDGLTFNFGRGPCTVPPAEYADARGWASTVPAIAALRIGPDGGLWVQRMAPGEDFPPIDRFGPAGSYRGTLPPGTPLPALLLMDGAVGVIATDELDVDRLVVLRPAEGDSEDDAG